MTINIEIASATFLFPYRPCIF